MQHDTGHYEQGSLWSGEHDADPAAQRQRFEAIAALLPAEARSVVELGSGDGRVLAHLRRPKLVPIAVDRSLTALRRWDGISALAGIDHVPLRDRAADAVLCCEVLEHLPASVLGPATGELARIARSAIVVTVPNRENRRRNAITCTACRCRYNPDRHLRSFDEGGLADLIPGFRLAEWREAGPFQPIYPRLLRAGLERAGVLTRPGSPSCPQCGAVYEASSARRQATATGCGTGTGPSRLARLAPRRRHPYWLCARFERSTS